MCAENTPGGPPDLGSRHRRRAAAVGAAVLIAAIIILLLLLRSCRKEPPPAAGFDYFDAQAQSLGRDRAKVLQWVRALPTLPYRGNARGALAALWHAAGSPEEKLALARAVVADCSDKADLQLADVCDVKGQPLAAKGKLRLVHRGKGETVVWEGPVGSLVGDAHTIETPSLGTTRVTLRAQAAAVKDIPTAGADGETVVFQLEIPAGADGSPQKLTVERELWHKDNAAGPAGAAAGDRHDFVVLPCRMGKYVRQKEELLLAQRGAKDAPHARPYLALLDYALLSDSHLAAQEKRMAVAAGFDVPRILILSTLQPPYGQGPWHALVLRLNRAGFVGPAAKAYEAAMVRSYVEAGLEHHFLCSWTQQPCTSAHDVFSRLKDDYPNSPDRRLRLAAMALEALAGCGGADGKVVFTARGPSGAKGTGGAQATAVREGGRLVVTAGGVRADVLARVKDQAPGAAIDVRGTDMKAATGDAGEAALVVELALMAAGAGPDYVLDVQIDTGSEPLVVEGARFVFRWKNGPDSAEQQIRVQEASQALAYRWRVRTGVRPVAGTRSIDLQAVDEALVHNPWYVAGDSRQDDATSFCLSRRVLRSLRGPAGCELTLLGKREQADEKALRPVEWKGTLVPLGPARRKVRVNGRDVEVGVLRFRAGDVESAVLDDAIWPVGMADRLEVVETAIRGRVVDEKGLGHAGLTVELATNGRVSEPDGELSVGTWPDGRFRLPPAPPGGRKEVQLIVKRDEEVLLRQNVNLSAPGLEEVRLTVPRARRELVFIHPGRVQDLEELKLAPQATRHARAELAAGRSVMIPNRPVQVNGSPAVAFYALDRRSGDITAVMDDGLRGSSSPEREAWKAAIASAAGSAAKAKGKLGNMAFVHMLRGANTAWWT
jgi:hypothetical protein